MASMEFTAIEKEVISLEAANESINSMVNYQFIRLSEGDGGAQAIFKTSIHQRLFNIILLDFLSKSSGTITGKNISCLDALAEICEGPNFNQQNSVRSLKRAVEAFKKWLGRETKEKGWYPSISREAKLKVQRQEFITICGDIAKHNFSRLSRRADHIKNVFLRSGIELSDDDKLLVLDEFYEKYHDDIFAYHGSHLVEQLNNIRWGMQQYLLPEFKKSIVFYEGGTSPRYKFTCPSDINAQFAKHCYSALMNGVRATPFIKRFKTYKILKKRY